MARWHRYGRSIDETCWDTDTAVTHESENDRSTLCGVRIPSHEESDGRWEKGWPDHLVTCKRCLKKMGRTVSR